MKKIYVLLVASVCLFMTTAAQEKTEMARGFIGLSVGPSFPVGDFSSTDFNNEHAAYAKIGINIDLQGGYHLSKTFVLAGSAFFSVYSFDEQKLKDQMVQEGLIPPGAVMTVDHWKYYGFVVGPMITFDFANNTKFDLSVMTGLAGANSPKAIVTESGTSSQLAEDWSTTMPLKINAGIRMPFGSNMYFAGGVNYIFLEPDFTVGSSKAHQQIQAVTVTAGVGFRF